MAIKNLIIKGVDLTREVAGPSPDDLFNVKASFQIGRMTRDMVGSHTVELKEKDVVEMVFEDGTTWFSGCDTITDIFPEALSSSRGSAGNVFEVPLEINGEGTERGVANKVLLKALNIFTRKAVDAGVEKLADKLENSLLDGKTGLFALDPDFVLKEFIPDDTGKPYILLIHGTASSARGSFGEARDTALMKYLCENHRGRILAFQHRTLTENPLQNVRDLVGSLPKNCVLHLITTSRGGLVGEVLSRFCNGTGNIGGFTGTELSILQRDYPGNYYRSLEGLIEEIEEGLLNKRIVVEKFIRIACPAGGTTLASKRLDHYFNITFNLLGLGLGLSSNPVYAVFKNLIAAVIDTKNKVEVLPGLEVQNPDSPFIRVLNAVADPGNPSRTVTIDNSLAVIAGNSKVPADFRALWVIAGRLFFRRDNDLVVDTGSMALGTRRSGRVQQFFHEDADINHFRYFANRATNSAVLQALQTKWGDLLAGFSEEQTMTAGAADRNSSFKPDGGQIFKDSVTGAREIVVLLPGIMGSNLTMNEDLLWINYWKIITGGLSELRNTKDILASSLVSTSYKQLVENLGATYDVVTFPYDWRLDLTEAVGKLNNRIIELMKYRQPIKIIGHSMGGVLVRDFIISHRETWTKLNKSKGFKLIFLGSPLGGSFRIPAVLCGMDSIINKLGRIDLVQSKKELVKIFSGFRGLLSLLPLSPGGNKDFAKPETWESMKRGIGQTDGFLPGDKNTDWPSPSGEDLNWFAGYRKRVCEEIQDEDYVNAVYIAGKDPATPCDFRIDQRGGNPELVFLCTAEGDQSVTWDSGIPAGMVRNNSVYYVNVTHGSLADEPLMFNGIREILAEGSTNLFSRTRPSVRGEEKLFRLPESRDFDLSLAGVENTILGLGTKNWIQQGEAPVRVSVSQGDLFYSRYPLLAGHFEDDGILYGEMAINGILSGALSRRHQLGIYPGPIGTSELFLSKQEAFKGTIIIGLGKPGNLTASELTRSVEDGVAIYLLQLATGMDGKGKSSGGPDTVGISSLLVGSGYGGLSGENSIKAILQGVQNANAKVKNLKQPGIRTIEHLEFIEQYEDKALSGLYSLGRIEKEETRSYRIILERKGIDRLLGGRIRLPVEESKEWWNRITVTRKDKADDVVDSLKFSVSTGSSREEIQELYSTPALMDGLISEISTDNRWTPELAKTIFELLIPNNFKEQLKRRGNINWILDRYAASYPWELLQDELTDARPICVSAGMVRQLFTDESRSSIETVPKMSALVIADPNLHGFAGQLPGALEEGRMVSEMLRESGMDTTVSLKENHSDVIIKLFHDDYKIIHLSGHGIFNLDPAKGSGMVIGENKFLSTREIRQMSTSPELVFVNCCHLGKSSGTAEEFYRDRYKLAANIGTQLIQNGVKCVIAAGWAVNDAAALDFAKVFYRRMFEGYTFGESIREARRTVYENHGHTNTWGAYQCYGDPFYRFEHLESRRDKKVKTYMIAQEAEVDLMNLGSEVQIGRLPSRDYLKSLAEIIEAVDQAGIRSPGITEKEAFIYRELGEYGLACEKFEVLMKNEEASYSFSVAEKYFNSRAKKIIDDFNNSPKSRNQCLREITRVIGDLEILIELSPTSKKWNILGSTYKRQGYLSGKSRKLNAYIKAAQSYQRGYTNHPNWYSLTNWLVFESVLVMSGMRSWDSDTDKENNPVEYKLPSIVEAQKALDLVKTQETQNTERMSYWDMLAGINIRLCKYILQFNEPDFRVDLDTILQEISELWKRAGSKGKRFGEIGHLEFIIDALSIKENENTNRLKKSLEELKNNLIQLI